MVVRCFHSGFVFDCRSVDVPFVGELEGKPGAFITAGHCGHGTSQLVAMDTVDEPNLLGMARAMVCARGIAALIRGESWSKTDLPECFRPTTERLARTD
jgi:hypothetical protein